MSNWANPIPGSGIDSTPRSEALSDANGSRPYHVPQQPRSGRAEEGFASMEELATLKVRFLAVLNHEIRTPLSGIMGMTDLLLETKLDEEQKEYVSAARSCAETLFEVLNATLEYSALSSGKVRLEDAEFHVAEVVGAAVAEHQFKADQKGLRLFSVIDPKLPETIVGDAMRVRQILAHLISNAIKFTPQGEVELKVSFTSMLDGKAYVRFAVRDTGIGVAADQLAHIFDSFRQLDSGLSRAYAGLGLGLALVEKLTVLMSGRIWAESTVGEGSTFYVEMPFAVTEMHGTVQQPQEVVEANGSARILLVEDNEVAQRIFSHVLRRGKYLVECAGSGADALRAVRGRRYDLILMDLQMPGMNGIDTTCNIREVPGYRSTPIIALTANTAEEHRRHALESGMQGFLVKPIPSEELLTAVAQFLRQA